MRGWSNRVPITVRLPLAAATMIFVVAVSSTQIAIHNLSRQLEVQFEVLGQVYLDGLSAALLPHALGDDRGRMTAVLEQALAFHEGIVDRRLVFLDAAGEPVARADRRDAPPAVGLPRWLGERDKGLMLDADGTSVWVWRRLTSDGSLLGTVAANLDVGQPVAEQRRLRWLLIAFDLAFSAVCAVFGFFIARRIQWPINTLADHLGRAVAAGPAPIPEADIRRGDRETVQLLHAYNVMAHAAREREAILSRLADQERAAVLGRLVATIAHEVRNPLAGILTAVDTVRKFGERTEARTEALDFIERGLVNLRDVVDATLETHRSGDAFRSLTPGDLQDVRLLIAADAGKRGVAVDMDVDIPEHVPVSATEVRQVLLNLLLNATRATSAGGRVVLQASVSEGFLLVDVWDEGPGLSPELAERLEQGTSSERDPGLGVSVIIRLVERLHGRVSVDARAGKGTRITLRLPLQDEMEAVEW
jgi:signal transduction histidine kinase